MTITTTSDIERRVIEVVTEQAYLYPDSSVVCDSKLADLGMDSLDEMEVIMALEDEFGIFIDDDAEVSSYTTVEDLINLVTPLVNA